jgi:hypothetical protein
MSGDELRTVLRAALQTAWGVGYLVGGALPFYAAVPGFAFTIRHFWIAGLIVAPIAFVVGAVAGYWTGPRMSLGRWIARGQGELISQDDYGKLWTLRQWGDEEPLFVVEVVNMTPEADGSYAHHFLRVPSWTRTAREAVAWTFGFDDADDYILAMQT